MLWVCLFISCTGEPFPGSPPRLNLNVLCVFFNPFGNVFVNTDLEWLTRVDLVHSVQSIKLGEFGEDIKSRKVKNIYIKSMYVGINLHFQIFHK